MQGWISIHRKLLENEIWTEEPFTRGQAWVDLLLLANHSDGHILVRGNYLKVKRGQVGWSILKLQKRWKWGRTKTENFLKHLENEHQITQQKNRVSSIITIVNYEKYQGTNKQTNKQTRNRPTNRPTTNNNDNNDNNDNKYIEKGKKTKKFKKPTIEEIKNYCTERKNSIIPQRFFDFYESKGWMVGKNKMKDWKACVRTWEQRNKKPKHFESENNQDYGW